MVQDGRQHGKGAQAVDVRKVGSVGGISGLMEEGEQKFSERHLFMRRKGGKYRDGGESEEEAREAGMELNCPGAWISGAGGSSAAAMPGLQPVAAF